MTSVQQLLSNLHNINRLATVARSIAASTPDTTSSKVNDEVRELTVLIYKVQKKAHDISKYC